MIIVGGKTQPDNIAAGRSISGQGKTDWNTFLGEKKSTHSEDSRDRTERPNIYMHNKRTIDALFKCKSEKLSVTRIVVWTSMVVATQVASCSSLRSRIYGVQLARSSFLILVLPFQLQKCNNTSSQSKKNIPI